MRYKLLNAVAATVLLTVVVGCGRNLLPAAVATPTSVATASSIPVTELTHEGFLFGAAQPALLAAPSLADLLGLLHGVGVFPRLEECNRLPQLRAQCWLDVKDPGNSLMVAAAVEEPCMVTNSVTAALTATNEIDVTVVNSGSCGQGGMAPLPFLSLLAIPLSALPADEITIKLLHTGVATPPAKMMVDLRRPLNIYADVQTRMNEVLAAITAATNDAMNRVVFPAQFSFLAIGTDRWSDSGLGCPIPGQAYTPADARGYVVFLRESDQPLLAMEYHVFGATLVFCGRVAL